MGEGGAPGGGVSCCHKGSALCALRKKGTKKRGENVKILNLRNLTVQNIIIFQDQKMQSIIFLVDVSFTRV